MKTGIGHGIDVSKWQPSSKFDWEEVAKIQEFCICRAAYGVRSDPTFRSHFMAAKLAGLQVGAYIFFRQTQGWVEQLESFQGELERVGFGEGDIIPVVDLEANEDYDGAVNAEIYNSSGRRLVEALRAEYGGCLLYLPTSFFLLLGKPAWMLDYSWWVAHYGVQEPRCPFHDYVIWQYSGLGKIHGYYGKTIDVNWRYKELPLIKRRPRIISTQPPSIQISESEGEVEPLVVEQEYDDERPTKPEGKSVKPPAEESEVVLIQTVPNNLDNPVYPNKRKSWLAGIVKMLEKLLRLIFGGMSV